MRKPKKYYVLRGKRGIGGLTTIRPRARKQARRFKSDAFYAVVFFAKVTGIPASYATVWDFAQTLSQSKKAAISKFMDRLDPSCTWKQYHDAGWRVRKVKVVDLGDG